jgi:ABC-type phosphate/phosphonate transport system permease subunit
VKQTKFHQFITKKMNTTGNMAIWITVIAVACIPIICLIRGREALRVAGVETFITLTAYCFNQTGRRFWKAMWKWGSIFLFSHRFS